MEYAPWTEELLLWMETQLHILSAELALILTALSASWMELSCLTVCQSSIHRQSMHVCVNAGSSPLTGLSSGTHRLRIVPVGCSENRGKTIRFEV